MSSENAAEKWGQIELAPFLRLKHRNFRNRAWQKRRPVLSVPFFQLLLALVLATAACRQTPTSKPRYAVLRFENLSGEPSLDWVARAAGDTLAWSLAGTLDGPVASTRSIETSAVSLGQRQATAPGNSTERAAALLTGANRLISGYVELTATGPRIVADIEDVVTGKTLRTESVTGKTPGAALHDLAHLISPAARPFRTTNDDALRLYESGLPQAAVAADHNFGPAWIAVERVAARGQGGQENRDEALALIARAEASGIDPVSHAQLDFDAAALRGDKSAEVASLHQLSNFEPSDNQLLETVAEADSSLGNFKACADDWAKVTVALPDNLDAWNKLGYARSWAGDYPGALTALRQYERLDPKSANPSDSMGDAGYIAGKFSDAASHYLDAYAKDPKFLQAGDLYKAAWARYRVGDTKAGDALFDRFFNERKKAGDAMVTLQKGDWLWRTGRHTEADTLLRQSLATSTDGRLRSGSAASLAIWDLIEGNRERAAMDANGSGLPSSPPLTLARFASLPSASPEEWQQRAERMIPLPAMAQVRRLALGYALVFDGKRAAALPLWKEAARDSPATEFFAADVVAKLEGNKPPRELIPDPVSLNQFLVLAN